jgi:hypothetical protein
MLDSLPVKQRELIRSQSSGDDQLHARTRDVSDRAFTHSRALQQFSWPIHNVSFGFAPVVQHEQPQETRRNKFAVNL